MTALTADLPRFGPGLGIFGALEAIRRLVQAAVGQVREPGLDAIRDKASAVGAALLEARSREDLLDLADEKVVSSEFGEALLALLELAHEIPVSVIEDFALRPELSPSVTAAFGDGPAGKIQKELFPLLPTAVSVYFQVLAQHRETWRTPAWVPSALAEYLTNETIPVAVRQVALEAVRGEVFALAIITATERGTRLEPWLSLALVDGLIAAERSRLRLAASLPGIVVPSAVVPEHERLDLDALHGEVKRTAAKVNAWADQAQASGAETYLPFGTPDDEQS